MFSKTNITNGIFLKDDNILVDWKWNRQTFLEKTAASHFSVYANEKFNYFGYTISCTLFETEKIFNITFNYVKEKLVSVNIVQSFVENDVEIRYKYIQGILESNLGKPTTHSKSKKNEEKNVWKIKNIKVEHAIVDTFGLQQFLEIKPIG